MIARYRREGYPHGEAVNMALVELLRPGPRAVAVEEQEEKMPRWLKNHLTRGKK